MVYQMISVYGTSDKVKALKVAVTITDVTMASAAFLCLVTPDAISHMPTAAQ